MKEHRFVGALALIVLGLLASGLAHAQTRVTDCNPATPNNSLCVGISAVTTNLDGTAITLPISYSIEQASSASGPWTVILTGTTTKNFEVKNLVPGTYYFRWYATVDSVDSPRSNVQSKAATAPKPTPSAPVATIAAVISATSTPVYRIVGAAPPYKHGEFYGQVPVGRECSGPEVFKFRGSSFRRVEVNVTELWGTKDATNLAAPCA